MFTKDQLELIYWAIVDARATEVELGSTEKVDDLTFILEIIEEYLI